MPRFFKGRRKVVSSSIGRKMLCPHCGHDDFHVVERGKLTWLFGEKFRCEKCGTTFKHANLVRVNQKSRESQIDQIGTAHTIRHHKQKRRSNSRKKRSSNELSIKFTSKSKK